MEPVVVARSYKVVSTGGTRGNMYQRLLAFTTSRRKAPDGLLDPVLARYQVGRRVAARRGPHHLPGDGAHPVECVTITIPLEPPAARVGAKPDRQATATRFAALPRRQR